MSTTQDAAPDATAPDGARTERWDAVIVGGGVGGLVAARDLARSGQRVLVVEQRPVAGGSVASHTVAGLRLDSGAESFATRGGAVAALADELGLTEQIVTPAPLGAWVQLAHGAGPLPRTGLLGIPASPWASDVRRTIGIVGALRASLDRVLPASFGLPAESGSGSLGALVRGRMGPRVLDRLVRPVVAGVHAADPDDLAVDAVSPGLLAALTRHGSLGKAVVHLRGLAPAGAAVYGFVGGVHVLVDAVLRDLAAQGAEVRTGVRASGAGRVGPGDDGFEVTLDDGAGRTTVVRADRLVVATPEAVGLLEGLLPTQEPLVPDAGADVTLVTLVLDAPELDGAPRGTGVLVAPGTSVVRAKALTHATAKWAWLARAAGPGRHVVRLSYGSAQDPAATRPQPDPPLLDDASLTLLALHDASILLGVPLSADHLVAFARVAWSQALPRPSAEHQETVARLLEAVDGVPGLAVCGAWVAGNGLASVVPHARKTAAGLDPSVAR